MFWTAAAPWPTCRAPVSTPPVVAAGVCRRACELAGVGSAGVSAGAAICSTGAVGAAAASVGAVSGGGLRLGGDAEGLGLAYGCGRHLAVASVTDDFGLLSGRALVAGLLGTLVVGLHAVAPADAGGGGAGVLVEQDDVEEELAADALLAGLIGGDAVLRGPLGDMLVEQVLGVVGRAFLAVVVDREAEPLAGRVSRRRRGDNTHEHRGYGE